MTLGELFNLSEPEDIGLYNVDNDAIFLIGDHEDVIGLYMETPPTLP